MENKQKHLEFIQAVINRMANNSCLLKGWAVTLVAALFALSAKDTNHAYISIAYFPVITFWILDGYFLSQERLFRDLYDDVRKLDVDVIDFSMDTEKYTTSARNSWICSMFSPPFLWFYISLVLVMLIIMFVIK